MTKTPKSVALGGALRQARLDQNLTLRDFALKLSLDPGMLSRWENGQRVPRPEQVAQILTALGILGAQYREIISLAYDTHQSQWVATTLPEQRRQMSAFLQHEQYATEIIEVSPLLVPGLLQTTDYIRGIMAGGGLPDAEIEPRITTRVARKEAILRPRPAHLLALVGQAALYQGVGGRETTVAQLRYLLMVGRRPNVDLRIIPFGAGWHPGLEGSFQLIEGGSLTPSVFVDTRRSTLWLHKDDDVKAYKQAAQMVLDRTMSSEDSLRYIAHLAQRMETSDATPYHLAQINP